MHKRAGHRGPLQFTPGNCARMMVASMLDPHPFGASPGPPLRLGRLHTGEQERQRDVLLQREGRKQIKELEDETDAFSP